MSTQNNTSQLDEFRRALDSAFQLLNSLPENERGAAIELLSSKTGTPAGTKVHVQGNEKEQLQDQSVPSEPAIQSTSEYSHPVIKSQHNSLSVFPDIQRDTAQPSSSTEATPAQRRKSNRPIKVKSYSEEFFQDATDLVYQQSDNDKNYNPKVDKINVLPITKITRGRKRKLPNQARGVFKQKQTKTKKRKYNKKKGLTRVRKKYKLTSNIIPGGPSRIKGIRDQVYCKICKKEDKPIKRYGNSRPLKQHLISSHGGMATLVCRFCIQEYENYAVFQHFHQMPCRVKYWRYLPGTKITCDYCPEIFTNHSTAIDHVKKLHSTEKPFRPYICRICKKIASSKLQLFKHFRVHFPKENICLQCGEVFSNSEEYSAHLETHTSLAEHTNSSHESAESLLKCPICGKTILRKDRYDSHLANHKKYSCSHCPSIFERRAEFLKHNAKVHDVKISYPYEIRKHVCTICNKCFGRPGLLEIHLRIHTGEKPIECTVCKSFFRTRKALKKHEETRTHLERAGLGDATRERKYLCTICGKSYYRQKDLDRHNYTHNPELRARFSCPHCDYTCAENHRLKLHVALHFNSERRFICEICGAAFHAKSSLQEHTKFKHTTTYDFSCKQCTGKFKHLSGLRRHEQTHVPESEKKHECPTCHKRFDRLCNMRRHMRNVHKTETGLAAVKKFLRLDGNEHSTKIKDSVEQCTRSATQSISYDNRGTPVSYDNRGTPVSQPVTSHNALISLVQPPVHGVPVTQYIQQSQGQGHPEGLVCLEPKYDENYTTYYVVPEVQYEYITNINH